MTGVKLDGSWKAPSGMWFIIGPGKSMIIDPYVVSLAQVPYTPSGRGGLKVGYTTSTDSSNSTSDISIVYDGGTGTGPAILQFDAFNHKGALVLCGVLDPDDPVQSKYVFTKVAG